MKEVRIIGVGTFLPGEPVSNAKLEKVFSIRADWVDAMIGTNFRHFVVDLDTKELRYRLVDLCERAARAALDRAGIPPGDVDVAVLSTATPDHLMPATVNVVIDRLGLNGIPAFQIQAGCSGAVQGFEVAWSLLNTGRYRNALVMAGDAIYKYFDYGKDFKSMPASELINLALFGEGAGAVVLSADPAREGIRLEHVAVSCEGRDRQPGQILDWFGPAPGPGAADGGQAQGAKEDYKAIEKQVPRMSKETLELLLEATGRRRDDITWFLPPQLAGHISRRIAEHMELSEDRVLSCVSESANTGNATPYFQLEMLADRMRPGDAAVAVAIESSKWIKTGMVLAMD